MIFLSRRFSILLIIIFSFLALLAILCFRAELTTKVPTLSAITLDPKNLSARYPDAVSHFSTALRIPTISDVNSYQKENFTKFQQFLNTTYPSVSKQFIKKSFGNDALLYEWRGSNPNAPAIIMMGHYDVVPVEKSELAKWQQGPFSGAIQGGNVWGRGAIDNKFSVIAILEAVESLLKTGFQPTSTIYFAFGADEETGGTRGNALVANYLRANNTQVAYVLDEGLPINQGIITSIKNPIALIGVAEKGYLSVRLISEGESGHASLPTQNNAITRLSEVIVALKQSPLPPRWNPVADKMFVSLTPAMPLSYRIIFANLWLTRPLVLYMLAQKPTTNALIATTIAPTIIRGGVKDNVLPASAEAIINFRLAPGDTEKTVLSYLHSLADAKNVKVYLYGNVNRDPLPTADLNSSGFNVLSTTIQNVFPDAIIAPSLMIAGTDSRYYAPLTKNIFRFYPWIATKQDIERIHGRDERMAINAFLKTIHFYEQFILNSQKTL